MIQVEFNFVPPGGGETDYTLVATLPDVPRPGDYIGVQHPNEDGLRTFIVRRVWWLLQTGTGSDGTVRKLCVECEFARGGWSSSTHKEACAVYEGRGRKVPEMDVSAY